MALLVFCTFFASTSSVAAAASCSDVDAEQFEEQRLPASDQFRHARSLAHSGDYQAAIRAYRQLSRQYPDDVDYLFGEAQARFWAGQAKCSLELVSRARKLAPDYEDVWRLEYQVRRALDEGELDSFRQSAAARFPGAGWYSGSGAEATSRLRWDAGIIRESLDNGAADWQSIYAHLERRTPDGGLLSLALAEHRRFSLTDNEIAVGAAFRPARAWLLHGSLRLTPHAGFLPQTVLDAAAVRHFRNGWNGGASLRYREYPGDTVSTWGAHLERYFGRYRAAYHLDHTRLASTSSFSHRGVLDYYRDTGSRFSLTVAAGDEIDIVAPGQLLNMDTSAIAFSGRHPVGQRLNLTWRVGTHRQGSIYRRNHVGLSVSGEF